MKLPKVEASFPNIRSGGGYAKTSDPDTSYNCVGFAMGETRWWWPDAMGQGYWPLEAQRTIAIPAFVRAFSTKGYQPGTTETLQPGIQKVALFASGNIPKHAAVQQPTGRWKSKLGFAEDIEHDLRGLEGAVYGTVVEIFQRPIFALALVK